MFPSSRHQPKEHPSAIRFSLLLLLSLANLILPQAFVWLEEGLLRTKSHLCLRYPFRRYVVSLTIGLIHYLGHSLRAQVFFPSPSDIAMKASVAHAVVFLSALASASLLSYPPAPLDLSPRDIRTVAGTTGNRRAPHQHQSADRPRQVPTIFLSISALHARAALLAPTMAWWVNLIELLVRAPLTGRTGIDAGD